MNKNNEGACLVMSEAINNREYRKNVIKDILMDLHNGKPLEEARKKFTATFDGVASSEIAAAEATLIAEGVPLEEVQRLCDVHAALFKDSLQEDEAPLSAADDADRPGHPIHTLKLENRAIEKLLEEQVAPALERSAEGGGVQALATLKEALERLSGVKLHYQRKENLIFPYMEQHGITAPPKVMWGVDDEIRGGISAAIEACASADPQELSSAVSDIAAKINEMIFKEENIMVPMILEAFSQDEWKRIADESAVIGYYLIDTPPAFIGAGASADIPAPGGIADGSVVLPTGALQVGELAAIFNTLPIDITFVDKNDTVKYFSEGDARVFPRTKAIIGRHVINCHPPASVHIVEGILADFKSGKKSSEGFWINLKGKYVYIRYFAVRGEGGEYLGTLEVTQDIAPIQALTGEKRLVDKSDTGSGV